MKIIKCPICGKRIFDAQNKSVALIKIKCHHCNQLVTVKLVPEHLVHCAGK